MTDTFASPSDAADAIAEQAARLRQRAHRDSHAAAEFGNSNNIGAELEYQLKATRDDTFLECLSYVLASSEAAADAYIVRWAAANGVDAEAAVRVKDQLNANQLVQQRAEAKVFDALRQAGTQGLPKVMLDPLIARIGWRAENYWLKEAIEAGTVVEQRNGRSTRYVCVNPPASPLS